MPLSPSKALSKGAPRQSLAQLRRLQRLAGKAIMRSLGDDFMMQRTWVDGRDMQTVAAQFIKPNDRLTSFERLEIYNRQYWYRLIDCLYDDYPGMLAILGQERFSRLTREYLARYPSRSFNLRNLGSNLPRFLKDEPKWAKPYERMAQDMARFEWAQAVAFDGPTEAPITPEYLSGRDPVKLKLRLQPYIGLLELDYPLDRFSIAVRRRGVRSEASNAMTEHKHSTRKRQIPRPRPRKTYVAVHRQNNDLYFKRLEPAAYRLLTDLSAGRTLAQACSRAKGIGPKKIATWFTNWTAMGWFCKGRGA